MSKQANTTAINAFNSNHKDYDQHRPTFSNAIVDPFLAGLGLATKRAQPHEYVMNTDKVILELAAGTGKFTRNLVNNGWGIDSRNLIIVEPSSGMLESFKRNLPQINPKDVHNASSYEIPIADNTVDAVLIAQGFHWFADSESLKEINRVLKPDGKLGLIWNFDYPSISQITQTKNVAYINGNSKYFDQIDVGSGSSPEVLFLDYFNKAPWYTEISKKIYTYDSGVPQYRHGKWRKALEDSRDTFYPISQEIFYTYENSVDKDTLFEYWKTRSYITSLDEAEKTKVKTFVDSVLEKVDVKSQGLDGKLVRPMATHAVIVSAKKD